MLSSMILSVNTQKDNKGRGGLFHNYTMNPLTTPVVQAYPTHTCTTAEWNASAQPHMAVHTDPHCCRACRGGGPTGRGGAGEGKRRWKQHCQACSAADTTFTFATLPQFSDLTTPPPVRKNGSHFTVYITLIVQWERAWEGGEREFLMCAHCFN